MAISETTTRPDFDAYAQSVGLPFPAVVDELIRKLGLRLVADLAGVSETRSVREWAAGERGPRDNAYEKLRFALRITRMLEQDSASDDIARAFFTSVSPLLADRKPSLVLAHGELEEVASELLRAAGAIGNAHQT